MSDISPISRVTPPAISPAETINRPTAHAGTTPTRGSDKVELSMVSKYLAQLHDLAPRTDLVNNIKSKIAAGTYETPDKIDAAVNELADDLS